MEDVTTDMCEMLLPYRPYGMLDSYCVRDPATGDSILHPSAAEVVVKLNLRILSYILPDFVKDAGLTAAVMLLDTAMQSLPQSPVLQSWHNTLHTAAAQQQSDIAVIQSALQPFIPTDPSPMADVARLDFYQTRSWDKSNRVLQMSQILQGEDA